VINLGPVFDVDMSYWDVIPNTTEFVFYNRIAIDVTGISDSNLLKYTAEKLIQDHSEKLLHSSGVRVFSGLEILTQVSAEGYNTYPLTTTSGGGSITTTRSETLSVFTKKYIGGYFANVSQDQFQRSKMGDICD